MLDIVMLNYQLLRIRGIILGHEFTQYFQVGQLAFSPTSILFVHSSHNETNQFAPKVPHLF